MTSQSIKADIKSSLAAYRKMLSQAAESADALEAAIDTVKDSRDAAVLNFEDMLKKLKHPADFAKDAFMGISKQVSALKVEGAREMREGSTQAQPLTKDAKARKK